MAERHDPNQEQLDLLRSLPLGDSSERMDALWRQLMVFKTFTEGDLSAARSRRADAETAREHAEREAAASTRQLYENVKTETDRKLAEVERLRSEAADTIERAEVEKTSAKEAKKEAERSGERIVAEANKKAQEILEQARRTTQQECNELRRQALLEIRTILSRIETIRVATDEELEAQRIFTNVAKLRANSASLFDQQIIAQGASLDQGALPQVAGVASRVDRPQDIDGSTAEAGPPPMASPPGEGAPSPQARKNGGVSPRPRTKKSSASS